MSNLVRVEKIDTVSVEEQRQKMADLEFEEFRSCFEELPQHIKASAKSYTLVPDIVVDEECLTDSKSFLRSEENVLCNENSLLFDNHHFREHSKEGKMCLKRILHLKTKNVIEKRRKKLSQSSSKNRRVHDANLKIDVTTNACSHESLFDEIQSIVGDDSLPAISNHRMTFTYLRNTIKSPSPDSELCDSGNSTVHSPDDSLIAGSSNDCADRSFIQLELLEATHRALHKFFARHSDELELEIGDPIYVQKEAEDLWCEGINLRNGNRGIFPSAYVVDVEYNDFDPTAPQTKRERFLLTYLGSVETLYHKGNSVLCQAVHKITSTKHEYHSCILEVSDQGLKMYDRLKPHRNNVPTLDYFYSLKNVSFCGFHPQDSRFMGFITKHPQYDRFACHVFQAEESTRPVTESIGRAFKRFYQKYIETAYPTEDIYIE